MYYFGYNKLKIAFIVLISKTCFENILEFIEIVFLVNLKIHIIKMIILYNS